VLIGGIVLGLILGLLVGGRLSNLALVRLRLVPVIAIAVFVRFGTEVALGEGIPIIETLRLPLLAGAFVMLLWGLWANRAYPGMNLAFVGTLANALVIVVNRGFMPIWEPALTLAGLSPADVGSSIHVIVPPVLDASFLLHLGPLGDVIPVPLPLIQNVASVGDLFLAAGLAFFLFASVVRFVPEGDQTSGATTGERQPPVTIGTSGLSPAFAGVAALERPLSLGGRGPRLASPIPIPIPGQRPEVVELLRRHPYVRLALNGSFSALWAGQFISVFGDRIHQFALAAVVLTTTGSVVLTALAFVAASLPNLFLSPIAGTFVDRWDRKEVLVVSDILRAAVVLLIPIAAAVNVILVYPLIFIVTSISIFFRPARVAIMPQLVERDELVTANSAMWIGETIGDVIAYPLAGLFVASLMTALPLAFWIDSVTYLASAVLLTTIVVRPRATGEESGEEAEGFLAELRAGWRFLRNDTTLLANTLQASVAQFTIGILTVLTVIYCYEVYRNEPIGYSGVWGFMEAGIGAGNLIGGFVIGLIGTRITKGRMIIGGYTAFGLLTFLLAITNHVGIAVGLAFGSGIANMVFVIPSQALFQERTPQALLGRVVSFRFALVFGSMTVAMAIGSLMVAVVPATFVIALFGLVTLVTGLAGWFIPAIRNA
jgi:MFS transporter, DHA3 family, macrolide efflux protein